MWIYEKKLEYPVKITRPDASLAKVIISQLGGPDGEMGAATRYLQQRYSMPYAQLKGSLTDIGTEELGHIEIISSILFQLTQNLTPEQIKAQGFDTYFVDHTTGVYPQAASGMPFSAATLQVTGDTITDLFEDMAAEQKARLTYDNILRLSADHPEVKDVIRFLREREIVHFQRFGECLRIVQDNLDAKNYYAFNPSFDKGCNPPDTIKTPEAVPLPAAQTIPTSCGQGTIPDCETESVEPVVAQSKMGCNNAPAEHARCGQMMQNPSVSSCGCSGMTSVDCAPCGQTAIPYTPPCNRRMNRSCGCG